jgi:hypothetical protein
VIPIPEAAVVEIRVLSTRGCGNTPQTISLIEETARGSNIRIHLEKVIIRTQEQADSNRFLGSPTVQINGVDLDPDMRDKTTYGLT